MELTTVNLPSTMANNKAIGYARVSTKDQEIEGFSLDIQEESIRKYAKEHGLDIIEVVREIKPASKVNNKEPISDYDINQILKERPGLSKILARGVAKEFGHIIVYTRDRIARNTGLFLAINAYLSTKVQIHYSREGENLDLNNEHYNRLFEVILASFAELEANVISHRVKAGSEACVKNGCKPGGKVAYGFEKVYTPNKKNKFTIKADEEKMQIVNSIFKLYCDYGYGYPKIVDMLNKEYPSLNLKQSTVQSILRNEQYKGFLIWDRRGGRRNPGIHDKYIRVPLEHSNSYLDDMTWDISRQIYEKKTQVKDPKYFVTPFLLKGKLVCGICNQPMVTRNNQQYRVYRCMTTKGCQSELIIAQPELDEQFMLELPNLFTIESIKCLWNSYCDKHEKLRTKELEQLPRVSSIISEYQEKIKKLDTLLSLNLDHRIAEPVQELHVQYKKYVESMLVRKEQIEKIPNALSYRDFEIRLNSIVKNLDCLDPNKKRVLIDKIVDHVIVNKKDNITTLKIHLNINKML